MSRTQRRADAAVSGSTLSLTAIVILIVFAIIVVVIFTVRKRKEKRNKEDFAVLTSSGKALKCASMDKAIMRSSEKCGLDLPRMVTGKLCVDDACLRADDVRNINDLSGMLSEQNNRFRRRLDDLNESLDGIVAQQSKKRELISDIMAKQGRKKQMLEDHLSGPATAAHVGVFKLTNSSSITVKTPGVHPNMLKFYYFGSSRSKDEEWRTRSVPIGMSVGYANRIDGTQQCIQNSVNGRSMNAAGRFASSDHCIGFRYQGRNTRSRGLTTARVKGWSNNGFEIECDNHRRDSYVIFEAYGTAPSSGGSNGLKTNTGIVRLKAGEVNIATDFAPHSVVFRFLPHFIDARMDTRTSGNRRRSTNDNQDGSCIGVARRGGNMHQCLGNARHGSSTNRVRHFSSDSRCIYYVYPDQNGNVRDRTTARVSSWNESGIVLKVEDLVEPVYVMYTALGTGSRGNAETVHTGSVLLEREGRTRIAGLGSMRPKYCVFEMKAHMTETDENSASGRNTNDMPSVHGNCFGMASKTSRMQVAMCNSASGSSTNRSAYFARDDACAVMKYVDTNGRTLNDGRTVVSLTGWENDGVTLDVKNLAGGNAHMLMYTVYGTTGKSRGGNAPFREDFENLDNWNVMNGYLEVSSERTKDSSSALRAYIPSDSLGDNPIARMRIGKAIGSSRPSRVAWDWSDPSSAGSGGGLLLTDAFGNVVFAQGSDNPQWVRGDGDGWTRDQSGSYGEWVHVEFVPDWDNGTYEYEITSDRSGRSATGTGTLGGDSVEFVDIAQWHSGDLPSGNKMPTGSRQSPNRGYYVAMFIDNLKIDP